MKKVRDFYQVELKDQKEKDQYELLGKLMFIGDEIYNARMEKGWNQEDLAEKVKTTQRIISNIENSQINPGTEMLLRLAAALDLEFKYGNCYLIDNIKHRVSGFWIDIVETESEINRSEALKSEVISEDSIRAKNVVNEFSLSRK